MVLRLVEVSNWRFGGMTWPDDLVFFSCGRPDNELVEMERFLACCQRLRRRRAPCLSTVKDATFPHSLAISFPDPVADNATLILLREEAQGPFTRYEHALLNLAIDIGEECPALDVPIAGSFERKPALMRRGAPMLFILDRSYGIKICHGGYLTMGRGVERFDGTFADRLPGVIEEAVRKMTMAWQINPHVIVNTMTMPLPFFAVRVQSTESRDEEPHLAVTIERVRGRNILQRASEQYEITPRERDVLVHLLDGTRIEKIADRLSIATSTVNDHIRSLIARTKSSNRSQMLARILGWEGNGVADLESAVRTEPRRGDRRPSKLATSGETSQPSARVG